jgi:hypothetical protein
MNPAPTDIDAPAGADARTTNPTTVISRESTSIVTRMTFAASPTQVWSGLLFYEQITERPPLHLRLLLPVPIGTEGSKVNVGDRVKCLYEGGHLLKRITQIKLNNCYGFDVVEQNLAVGRGLTLSGGSYMLRELSNGCTEIAVATRYMSLRNPKWLWKPIEAIVCHMFHRHLLLVMRRRIEARNGFASA